MHCICPGTHFTQRKLDDVRCIRDQICSITRIEVSEYLQLQRRYVELNIVA
jgi:hypothetical protein